MNPENNYQISYGKAQVPLYRVYASPMQGITPIPESSFTGKDNTLFALEVDVEVFGNNFLPAYTHGDNSNVVATDTMKNFILKQALTFQGSTIESFLALLGYQFLATYPQMEQLQLTGRELPFAAVPVPQDNSSLTPLAMSATLSGGQVMLPYALPTPTFSDSNVLFKRTHDDYALATLDFTRDGSESGNAIITAHQSGRVGLQLLKVTGSSFTHFLRDAYTTLPERVDRPLFIYLDVYWKYSNLADVLASDLASPTQGRDKSGPYVPSEQVRDLVQVVFHEFVSESIQHLVNEIGMRLLARFPQLSEVSFDAQNRTRDPVVVSDTNPKLKVYSDPFPAYGMIKLTLTRTR